MLRTDNSDGAAAVRARLQVDCANHRQRNLHVWTLDASSVTLAEGDINEDWSPILPNTPGVPMESYVCADPASRKDTVSVGTTVPIAKVREMLNKPSTK